MKRWVSRRATLGTALGLLTLATCESTPTGPGAPGPCEHLRARAASDEPLCHELAQSALERAAGQRGAAASRLAALPPDAADRDPTRALVALMRARVADEPATVEGTYALAYDLAVRAQESEIAVLAAAEATMALGAGRRGEADDWLARLDEAISLGPMAPGTASVVAAARGRVATDAGRPDEGVQWLREAVSHAEVAFGAGSAEVAAALLNLGLGAKRARDADAAREAYDQAIEILDGRAGDHRRRLAGALAKRGTLHLQQRELPAATADLERARDEYTAILGAAHPDVAGVMVDLGLTEARAGRPAAALDRYDRAIEILGAADPADPVLAMALINRAAAWRKLDRLDAATDDDLSALAILEGAGRGDEYEAIGARINLAAIRVLQGRHQNAIDALERALGSLEASGRADSPAAAVAQINRCEAHLGLGELDVARAACTRAVEIRRASLSEDDPALQAAQAALARVTAAQHEPAGGEPR